MSFYTSLSGLKNAQPTSTSSRTTSPMPKQRASRKSRRVRRHRGGFGLYQPEDDPGHRLDHGGIDHPELRHGPIEQTGSALDLAITGDGFFTTKSLVTTATRFHPQRRLRHGRAAIIQDGSGNRPPDLRARRRSRWSIRRSTRRFPCQWRGCNLRRSSPSAIDGKVTASYADGTNDVTSARLRWPAFSPCRPAPDGIIELDGNRPFRRAKLSACPATGAFGNVLSGALERSNVDIAEELVSLITAQRYFQANAKAIDTATQIARPSSTCGPDTET
jgi:flagellar hook protein FlgE